MGALTTPVSRQMGGPDGRRADVEDQDRIVVGELVNGRGDVLRVQRPVVAPVPGQLVQPGAAAAVDASVYTSAIAELIVVAVIVIVLRPARRGDERRKQPLRRPGPQTRAPTRGRSLVFPTARDAMVEARTR